MRSPKIAFTVESTSSTEVATKLAVRGIFASNGDFYAMTVMERLGDAKDGVVRAGCACYTTSEEVERLIDGMKAITRAAQSSHVVDRS